MLICETTRHFLNIEDNIHVEFHSKERVQEHLKIQLLQYVECISQSKRP